MGPRSSPCGPRRTSARKIHTTAFRTGHTMGKLVRGMQPRGYAKFGGNLGFQSAEHDKTTQLTVDVCAPDRRRSSRLMLRLSQRISLTTFSRVRQLSLTPKTSVDSAKVDDLESRWKQVVVPLIAIVKLKKLVRQRKRRRRPSTYAIPRF